MGNIKGKDWFRVPEKNFNIDGGMSHNDFIFNHEVYNVCKNYDTDKEAFYLLENTEYLVKDLSYEWMMITEIYLGGHNPKLLELAFG